MSVCEGGVSDTSVAELRAVAVAIAIAVYADHGTAHSRSVP